MFTKELNWFYDANREMLKNRNRKSYEVLMFLSLGHVFGHNTPKALADHLGIPHQFLYKHLKTLSLYQLKKLLLSFMVKQAALELKAVLEKSASTKSRANIALHGDNSVIQRWGKVIRLIYRWYSGRAKQVVLGNDLLGIVLTINDKIIPLHLLFVSKQGRGNTNKPDLLIKMMKELKVLFAEEGIDITQFSLTLDSWFASQDLREKLAAAGFENFIVAGKSDYVFKIGKEKRNAKGWKRKLKKLFGCEWGVDVPCCRKIAYSPTFGKVVLFFFKKSKTRVYYLIDFSKKPGRCVEIWRTWQKHHSIEQFWRLLKSVLHLKSIQLRGDGLYAGLLIKVLTCILLLRLKSLKTFKKLSFLQIMRKIRREENLENLANEHFHGLFSAT